MKNLIIVLVVVIVIGFGAYLLTQWSSNPTVTTNQTPEEVINIPPTLIIPLASSTPPIVPEQTGETVIGQSVEGRAITAYHYPPSGETSGAGAKQILFIGGIHGGYSWNTTLLAYKLMDYLKGNPDMIPTQVAVTVIPVLNPDGLNKVVGTTTGQFTKANVSPSTVVVTAGRFNANQVDLNRNFDCDWQATGKWQNKTVSGGSAAFSEPESLALKNYVETLKPSAVVAWYSAAGGVFSSNCQNEIMPETKTITNTYAQASGYPAYEKFNFYEITGDLVNWLAKNNIPAISVLLASHDNVEWDKNLAGIKALLQFYAK
ncbi:MAG: M14 family zinc carboxypeptidase [Candidatus Vogelbacteria bacterium]